MSNWLKRWKALWHPNRYHGWGRSKSYFEGWYFKMVNADESLAFALIPGISIDAKGESHAFIQMIDGTEGKAFYEQYEADEFKPREDRFEVAVGQSRFSDQEVIINLPQITGHVKIENPTPWPSELGAPGVMGWYSFVPMMQCYHGVVSLDHKLSGVVNYEGVDYILDGGIGYIEKDWGTSFPKCWIWMQSNHFEQLDRSVSFMASVAHIPWMGRYFVGFLVFMWVDSKLYKFATYTGAKMTSSMDDDHVYLQFKQGKKLIKITAKRGPTAELISPIVGEMAGKVNESLAAVLHVKLTEGDKVIYEGSGRNAGLEVAGDISILLTDQ